MMSDSIMAFVTKADGKLVRVSLLDDSFKKELIGLGFSFDNDYDEYTFLTSGNDAKAELFRKLRDLGVAFSGGREWCPSDVFEYLRQLELLKGAYTKISWTAPGNYRCTIE
ncbi:hypothetical protein [Vibrio sp. CUB2]|uniref:hypothetical protein n=1 Tax=Vibrio sp. CUB2 TaxID=2315233 RepID=UPI00076A2F57|nr:hypothetical protein [Vibrio sp. CUB2]